MRAFDGEVERRFPADGASTSHDMYEPVDDVVQVRQRGVSVTVPSLIVRSTAALLSTRVMPPVVLRCLMLLLRPGRGRNR